MEEIRFNIVKREGKINIPENLVFGAEFTDHMFVMDYNSAKGGWINPTITKYEELKLSPSATVLHYGQEIFEGLKAYQHTSGKIALFRPEKNFERMNSSAKRLCMPELDIDTALNALYELIKVEKDWVPSKEGYSLYIRPILIGVDPMLGVKPSETYKFIIMLSPVGPYYPEGFKPVPILATDNYVRACKKGIGACKTGGNYAASLLAQKEAKKEGYSQVLWLDAMEQKYIEEVGTMNIFIHFKDEVVTPRLTGTILPGITRMSVLEILKDWKYNVNERDVSINEVTAAYDKGNLLELFGTGTAAIISSISKLKYKDKILKFSDEKAGELGTKLYHEILDIQNGKKEDRFNWIKLI